MKVILLSGGSGKRLWPLSNDTRSKQFLRLLRDEEGHGESMIQRTVRQLGKAGLVGSSESTRDNLVVATALSQKDGVENQLGKGVTVVTEPERRKTFPAILLACAYLVSEGVSADETIIVMPCDTYAGDEYFKTVAKMASVVETGVANLVLMGVTPTYPSEKYGYILPADTTDNAAIDKVSKFIEKPDESEASELIASGALWNGGVFGFKLVYIIEKLKRLLGKEEIDFASLRKDYDQLPRQSFDTAVAETEKSEVMVRYEGSWKDLGTWSTLTDELADPAHGNILMEDCTDTFAINELGIPMICIGAENLIVAASPDGILVSDRRQSVNLKHLVDSVADRPMYEERRWGEYRVLDRIECGDGFCALTKQLVLRPGASISYQRHNCRNEVWTFIDGEGEIVLDDARRRVRRGDVINIAKGQMHALRAITPLTFIEVQHGSNLVEEDIERFPYEW
ncbi:MAG: cupin domain-containing protein [Muribaculaceae bacterium]|nr:cupin domain-containing protein [Muribaculaceae bacterium]